MTDSAGVRSPARDEQRVMIPTADLRYLTQALSLCAFNRQSLEPKILCLAQAEVTLAYHRRCYRCRRARRRIRYDRNYQSQVEDDEPVSVCADIGNLG